VFTFFWIMHIFVWTLLFFIFIILCRNREHRFLRLTLKLRLWLILKNDDINMFNNFLFFLKTFLYSRIIFSKWMFYSTIFFCKIQLLQNVETYFRSTIKNFSTNIVSKSKKFLISKVKIRFLRFFQFIIQISIWFLNDDCFNASNFSCICFLI
jgi:hypothetical protein